MSESKKYPRTFHLEWSEGATNDDKISHDVSGLLNIPVVITEKMDGGCCSLEANGCFARSHSGSPTHASFDNFKALHSNIKYLIPPQTQLFGEWLYALHSIAYDKLPNYFLMFNVRSLADNMWKSWDEVETWAETIGVLTVPVLFKGIIKNEDELRKITKNLSIQPSAFGTTREGIVIRTADAFGDENFDKCVMKMVRKNHVNTDTHWKHKEIVRNKLETK